jgi:hypothetical protein
MSDTYKNPKEAGFSSTAGHAHLQQAFSDIASVVINHLNPAGIRDQLQQLKVEGIMHYVNSRFLDPLKSGTLLDSDDIQLQENIYFERQFVHHKIIKAAQSPTSVNELLRVDVFNQTAKLNFVIASPQDRTATPEQRFAHNLRKYQREPIAYFMPQIFPDQAKPPNDVAGSRYLSQDGIFRLEERQLHTIVPPLERKRTETFDSFGYIHVGDSGATTVLDYDSFKQQRARPSLEAGYLLQAAWILKSANYNSWLMHNGGSGVLSAIGKLNMADGGQKIIGLSSRARLTFPLLYDEVSRIANSHAAQGWELAGMENSGGGAFLSETQEVEHPEIYLYPINESRYAKMRDDMFVITQ